MMTRLVGVLLVAAVTVACGGGDPSPSTPVAPTPTPPPAPTYVNAAGLWTGTSRLTSATGGECVSSIFTTSIGTTTPITMQVTQNGSAVTAVVTGTTTGVYTNYSGTAGSSSISVAWTSCSAGILNGVRCSNGQLRDLKLNDNTLNANINGNSASGTSGETWNVYVSGTQTSVGILNVTTSYSMTR
jgi:hypothetical protein